MEIIVGKMAGFCGGVSNAVEKAKEELVNAKNNTVYCLGELVHNQAVMRELSHKGMQLIENIEQGCGKVIIRAHGVTKHIYHEAKRKGITLVDLTCKKVLKIHEMAQTYANKGYYIFLIGDKQHPEIIGTHSFCGENVYKLADQEDVDEAIRQLKESNIQKVVILAQTTYNMERFERVVNDIKAKLPHQIECVVHKTICEATKLRQEETSRISKLVDGMIIIGGKNSSNTKKLYEIAMQNCKQVALVENKTQLELEKWLNCEKVGIMAGASTPKESINEIVEVLEKQVIYA